MAKKTTKKKTTRKASSAKGDAPNRVWYMRDRVDRSKIWVGSEQNTIKAAKQRAKDRKDDVVVGYATAASPSLMIAALTKSKHMSTDNPGVGNGKECQLIEHALIDPKGKQTALGKD